MITDVFTGIMTKPYEWELVEYRTLFTAESENIRIILIGDSDAGLCAEIYTYSHGKIFCYLDKNSKLQLGDTVNPNDIFVYTYKNIFDDRIYRISEVEPDFDQD